jgi:alkanesulfonate monooxygenase SsuD/methylene tetrahydromethanopterin reductase-like flavin-dependent oxidoreductase (luciferase family)
MRYGFVIPGGTPREQVDLAVAAEAAGWDSVFTWEAAYGQDAWGLMAAMAERTSTIRLGTMLTPLPFRRPWQVAGQVATLDQLSGGRAILSVGLGAPEAGYGGPPDVEDRRTRAELLDEGIDMITGLWSGEMKFEGKHYDFDRQGGPGSELRPVQQPRPPIWCVGGWPRSKSMRRVLRCDGLLPNIIAEPFRPATPDDIRAMIAWLDENGGRRPGFDVVVEGETPNGGAEGAAIVGPFADAGATWWLDARWVVPEGLDASVVVRERIDAGPPRV